MVRGMRALLVLPLVIAACVSSSSPPAATANGTVATWIAAPTLPTPRANHCSAVIDNWVLVIGGNHASGSDFVKTDEIHAAQLAADGTLGPWQLAGKTPSPVSQCTVTTDGKTLYLIDGLYDDQTDSGQVFSADLDDSGHLGALAPIAQLPTGTVAISQAAAVRDGALLVMDDLLPDSGDDIITLRTPLPGPAGQASTTWQTDHWNIGFHAQSQYVLTDDRAYVIGGYHDPSVGALADVYVAPIGAT